MNSRDVLAANFKKLRDASPRLDRLKDIVLAGGGSNGTLGRIAQKSTGATIDTVEQLAQVYGLEAWQMLVPTLQAKQGAGIKPVVTGLPDWPFGLIDRSRYETLDPERRGAIQNELEKLIAVHEEQQSVRRNGTSR